MIQNSVLTVILSNKIPNICSISKAFLLGLRRLTAKYCKVNSSNAQGHLWEGGGGCSHHNLTTINLNNELTWNLTKCWLV